MDYVEIPLSGKAGAGKVMLVDADKAGVFARYKWNLNKGKYARTQTLKPDGTWKKMFAHHLVFRGSWYEGRYEQIHHKNNNGLDNRKTNLTPIRIGSKAGRKLQSTIQDKCRISRNGDSPSSRHQGVHWKKDKGKWKAQYMNLDSKNIHIGYFDSEETAGHAYQEKVKDVIHILEERILMEWIYLP
jgi:AP2 domain